MFLEEDIISTDKYLKLDDNQNIKYYKFDYLFQDGNWRGRNVKSCINNLSKIVLAGHSDYYMNDQIASQIKNTTKCNYIYSVNNKSTFKDWCFGLPLGVTNNTTETDIHPIYGNTDIMLQVLNEPQVLNIKKLVYMNINPNTNRNERCQLINMFENKEYIYKEDPVNTMDGRKYFLHQLRSHKFTLAPEGNGVDTHRLWETIYMGGIPIVKRSEVHKNWDDLPIAFINDWNELTVDWLNDQWELLKDKRKDMECIKKAKIGYWIDDIKSKI